MSDKITPWKNSGEKEQESLTLIRIRWDYQESCWVPDPYGTHLGFFNPGTEEYTQLHRVPRPKKPKDINLLGPNLKLGTPSLGVASPDEEE